MGLMASFPTPISSFLLVVFSPGYYGSKLDYSKDYMVICPKGFNIWKGQHVSDDKKLPLKELLGKRLDSIANGSLETTLLHEFTQSRATFQNKLLGMLICMA